MVETPWVSFLSLQFLVTSYCHRIVISAEDLLGRCCGRPPAGRLFEQAGRGARVHLGWLWGVCWWSGMAYTWGRLWHSQSGLHLLYRCTGGRSA